MGATTLPVFSVPVRPAAFKAADLGSHFHDGYFGGISLVPVGPMAVTWTITSPSLAQTKCGVSFGSEKNVPVGYGLSLLSHAYPYTSGGILGIR